MHLKFVMKTEPEWKIEFVGLENLERSVLRFRDGEAQRHWWPRGRSMQYGGQTKDRYFRAGLETISFQR